MDVKVAIIGATGLVGRECITILKDMECMIDAVASDQSAGSKIVIAKKSYDVRGISSYVFDGVDVAFICTSSSVAKNIIPKIKRHVMVIDNSSAFRMDASIPLVVAKTAHIDEYYGASHIASPNCIVTPVAMILNLVPSAEDIVLTTFQSLSGAGQNMLEQKGEFSEKITPYIGGMHSDGQCDEELKIVQEVEKICGKSIHVLCTRAPLSYLHQFHISFKISISYRKLLEILEDCPYISFRDCSIKGTMLIKVSRVMYQGGRVSLWAISDNLHLGAAGNMVEIFKRLAKERVI
jgi:aspartate-semialdehyde dehydrogenase